MYIVSPYVIMTLTNYFIVLFFFYFFFILFFYLFQYYRTVLGRVAIVSEDGRLVYYRKVKPIDKIKSLRACTLVYTRIHIYIYILNYITLLL